MRRSSIDGRIPFLVAIVTVVVGPPVATCGVLIGHVLSRSARSVALLRAGHLDQLTDTAVREVGRLPLSTRRLLHVL